MSSDISQISEREREILRLVAMGATNQQIGDQLHISVNTVKVHLRNIFEKIGATSRTEATVYALRFGLIQLDHHAESVASTPENASLSVAPLTNESVSAPSIETLTDLSVSTANESLLATPIQPDRSRHRLLLIALGGAVVVLAVVLVYVLLQSSRSATQPSTSTLQGATSPANLNRWMRHSVWPDPRANFALAAYDSKLYTIGGSSASGPSAAVDRYDPTQDQWVSITPKPTPVSQVQAVRIGGRIYVPGGEGADGEVLTTFEAYDPRSQQWETLPPLPAPRSRYALADFEGQLYLFGGWDGSQVCKEVFAYDPVGKKWEERDPLPTARSNASAALLEDHIYVIGGENTQGPQRVNERFDPTNTNGNAWETVVPLAMAIATPAVINTLDSILVFDPQARIVTQYTPAKDSWTPPLNLPAGTFISARALPLGSSVFLFGPATGAGAGTINEYRAVYTTLFPVIGNGQ